MLCFGAEHDTYVVLNANHYLEWAPNASYDHEWSVREHLALLLRLGRGAPPPDGLGGLGALSTGSPAAAASLSALPSQYSLQLCSGSSASMASVNCTDRCLDLLPHVQTQCSRPQGGSLDW